MKLRNKKTGEIVIADITHMVSGVRFDCGQSLAELNEEWEDYEEPKEYWYVDEDGEVWHHEVSKCEDRAARKSIGNYFETEEEAEKAVEKLKSWKRLKDKGFRFYVYRFLCNDGEPHYIEIKASIDDISDPASRYARDLRLLFGGEE